MKKADAAAAAELRLVNVSRVPEIFTDRNVQWTCRDDDDEKDDGEVDEEDNGGEDADSTAKDSSEAPEGDPGIASGDGTEHVKDTPPDASATPAAASPQPPWPFPTTDSVGTISTTPSGTPVA